MKGEGRNILVEGCREHAQLRAQLRESDRVWRALHRGCLALFQRSNRLLQFTQRLLHLCCLRTAGKGRVSNAKQGCEVFCPLLSNAQRLAGWCPV